MRGARTARWPTKTATGLVRTPVLDNSSDKLPLMVQGEKRGPQRLHNGVVTLVEGMGAGLSVLCTRAHQAEPCACPGCSPCGTLPLQSTLALCGRTACRARVAKRSSLEKTMAE